MLDQDRAVVEWDRWEPAGQIELDRFCNFCGYNLRTQLIRVEPATHVFMCRCPECFRFHAAQPAGQTSSLLRIFHPVIPWIWLGACIWFVGFTLFCGAGLTAGLLDELTRTSYQQVNGITVHNVTLRPAVYMREAFIGLIALGAFTTGLLGTSIATVVFYHWRRWGYRAFAVATPTVSALLVTLPWILFHAPNLASWSIMHASINAGLQIVGGLLGVVLGRPATRGLVRLLMPPAWRPPFAFLWLADGRTPPSALPPSCPGA
jgi:hypothetical protein